MKKIFVDLGPEAVGVLKNYGNLKIESEDWILLVLQEGGIDDGAYCPPQDIRLGRDALKNLYDALKAIYEPPA